MQKENSTITSLINNDCCFDLQFRKDTRHKRTGSPTYYRWKLQFVITSPKEKSKLMQKVKSVIGCGEINTIKDQARFSVQRIDDIYDKVVPYFRKNKLTMEKKKKDFELWQRAVEIIYKNKGVYLTKWKKSDLHSLMEIHKSTAKYKQKPRKSKWMEMAKTLTKKEA
ncbi:MAG: hypothetical protein A3F47_02525 [Candidatus Staskawiczbacteria bacterium RIFCSPHIGHO2_12_FULL_38_11]|uniref:Homing endonuclease LAGLIDADG domain-containing protein n=1 Tax=Candidatus Staskawiczbacteria bacterium RIFCSPHIGHO2_12_FULL_38_11 TaxID=1802209 RepID=A0A1G2I4C6_9BACT|nr:MAG: hypothetical protein A3F47_02525 [Candidatus Staskawiczbacteria bacterium RIFCSPHIGHO2_12_FULL_38_11]